MLRRLFQRAHQFMYPAKKLKHINMKQLPRLKYWQSLDSLKSGLTSEIEKSGKAEVRKKLQEEKLILQNIETIKREKRQQYRSNVVNPAFKRVYEGYSLTWFKQEERTIYREEIKNLHEIRDGLKGRQILGRQLLP